MNVTGVKARHWKGYFCLKFLSGERAGRLGLGLATPDEDRISRANYSVVHTGRISNEIVVLYGNSLTVMVIL